MRTRGHRGIPPSTSAGFRVFPDVCENFESSGRAFESHGARQGTGPYPVRLDVVLRDQENLQLVSVRVSFDSSSPTRAPRLESSVTGGRHAAKIDALMHGRGRLVGYNFRVVGEHLFEAESTAGTTAVLFEGPSPRHVLLHYEEVSRESPQHQPCRRTPAAFRSLFVLGREGFRGRQIPSKFRGCCIYPCP